MLSWDCMPASGGSQLHTHMHGFVGRGHKLGHFRGHEEARKSYERKHHKSDLTQDYINVHIALGLGLRLHGWHFFPVIFRSQETQNKPSFIWICWPRSDGSWSQIGSFPRS